MHQRGWRSFNAFKRKKCTYRSYSISERPPSLPKPIPDIKHIRLNPELYKINCQQRNYPQQAENGWTILSLQQKLGDRRKHDQDLFAKSKAISKQLGQVSQSLKSGVNDPKQLEIQRDQLLSEARSISDDIAASKLEHHALEANISDLALQVPNLNAPPVPDGPDPEVVEYINVPPSFSKDSSYDSHPESNHSTSHLDIASELGLLDMPAASRIAGTGFYYFLGAGALLEQALIQHALHTCLSANFVPVSPPTLVHKYAASMAGYAPRDTNGETQIFALEHEESEPQRVLTGTSEIALAGMFAGEALKAENLPKKYVGISRCYRAEAGGRGKDTKGVYRVHEFTKVEMFAWTLPDQFSALEKDQHFNTTTTSAEESFWAQPASQMFNEILDTQKRVLAPLGLPLRVLNMPPPDLGASAAMKYDIETVFPSRKHAPWGELASLSLCTDYQSRRMGTTLKSDSEGSKFPYTLNGTALAVPRVWAAILENGWDEKRGLVKLPECLWKWMGSEVITRPK
jgi:seryl-tRNA synthetase